MRISRTSLLVIGVAASLVLTIALGAQVPATSSAPAAPQAPPAQIPPGATAGGLTPQQQAAADAEAKAQAAAATNVPRKLEEPGLANDFPDYSRFDFPPPGVNVPEGFTPIFNGKDLSGWHISKTANHGHDPEFRVLHGVITGTQQPWGHGGLLLSDKKYRSFELSLEAKPDWGCDSGIMFRITENGAGYQITMDYLGNGNGSLGRMIGEGGLSLGPRGGAAGGRAGGAPPAAAGQRGNAPTNAAPAAPANAPAAAAPTAAPGTAQGGQGGGGRAAAPPSAASLAWRREAWNAIRVRVEGDAPKVTVWINGQQVNEQQDTENHAVGGMLEGPIALQVHGGSARWTPGGFWRWRNIAIKELPARQFRTCDRGAGEYISDANRPLAEGSATSDSCRPSPAHRRGAWRAERR